MSAPTLPSPKAQALRYRGRSSTGGSAQGSVGERISTSTNGSELKELRQKSSRASATKNENNGADPLQTDQNMLSVVASKCYNSRSGNHSDSSSLELKNLSAVPETTKQCIYVVPEVSKQSINAPTLTTSLSGRFSPHITPQHSPRFTSNQRLRRSRSRSRPKLKRQRTFVEQTIRESRFHIVLVLAILAAVIIFVSAIIATQYWYIFYTSRFPSFSDRVERPSNTQELFDSIAGDVSFSKNIVILAFIEFDSALLCVCIFSDCSRHGRFLLQG